MWVLAPGRPQSAIYDAKACAQQAGYQEAAKRFCRADHPNSLRQKPPGALGSS